MPPTTEQIIDQYTKLNQLQLRDLRKLAPNPENKTRPELIKQIILNTPHKPTPSIYSTPTYKPNHTFSNMETK